MDVFVDSGDLVIVVDFSWVMYRYKYGFSNNLSVMVDGVKYDTGAAYGFLSFITNIVKKGNKVVLALDVKSEFRRLINKGYKCNRVYDSELKDSFDEILNMSVLCDSVSAVYADDLEADDVMAILGFKYKSLNENFIIYSGDSDLWQLAPEGIFISNNYSKGKFSIVDDDTCNSKFGVNCNLINRYKPLLGDSADNITPAVSRVPKQVLKDFAYWATYYDSYYKALDKFKESMYFNKLKDSVRVADVNYEIMDLTRYQYNFNDIECKKFLCDREYAFNLANFYSLKKWIGFVDTVKVV